MPMPTLVPAPEPSGARAERTRLLYRIGRTGVVVHATLVGTAVAMFWTAVPRPLLCAWGAGMLAVTLWRAWFCRHVIDRGPDDAAMARYQRLYDHMILLTGVGWGVATVLLFVPDDPGLQAVLALLVGGTAAGAVGTLSADLGTVHRALLPSLIPLSANFLLRGGDRTAVVMGLLMVLFLGALSAVARNFNATLREALTLRHQLAAKTREQAADIVRRRAVEADLRAATRRAETAVAAKSRFLARASHDLRQPLHALGLLVATLDRRLTVADDRDILWRIGQSVDSMALLFNALLDISRLDAGAVQPEIKAFHLDDLLAPMVDEFRLLAEVKGLSLRHVPCGAVVRSDPALLSAIVRNLLANAIRYTPSGGILIGCRRLRGGRRLEVWDTGIGIPEDQQEHVFEEFAQVSRPCEDGRDRFGLGLSIVRRLGHVLGHPVTLRSTPGRGSVFAVGLPEAPAEATAVAPLPPSGTRRLSLDGLHVLVVDDDDEVRDAMRLLIEGWGGVATTAASAATARAAAATGPRPALLVVDLDLPDGDGRTLIEALRGDLGGPVPAILVTGDILAQARAEDGVVLHKPVAPSRLRTLINRLATARPPPADGDGGGATGAAG
jgi:signal transduction histidine kinase